MGTIALKLAAPLQSWGSSSRFTERETNHEPTKSGIIGLLAAALGRRRTDTVDDLVSLSLAVRIDQSGKYLRDFQTAHRRKWDKESGVYSFDSGSSMPLSNRQYLADAVFVVAVQVEDDVLYQCLTSALEHPSFPLFLGRRSCPPACKVLLGAYPEHDMMTTLANIPWQASEWYQRSFRKEGQVELEIVRDMLPSDDSSKAHRVIRDIPLSFSQIKRDYTWRSVIIDHVVLSVGGNQDALAHDPWGALECDE